MKPRVKGICLLLPALVFATNVFGQPIGFAPSSKDTGRCQRFWVFIEEDPDYLARDHRTHSPAGRALERRQRRGSLSHRQYQRLDLLPREEYLQRIRATGAHIRQVSRWLQAVSVEATGSQAASLAMLTFVKRVEPVRKLCAAPPSNRKYEHGMLSPELSKMEGLDYGPSFGQLNMLNIPAVHQLGYSGRDVLVLILDTGFYKEHEAMRPDRIAGEYDFVSNDTNTQDETADEIYARHHSHGTQVWSVLGGYSPGQLIGPAYECDFLLAKTEIVQYDTIIEEDNFVAALEWGEAMGADIATSSVGYLDWYTYDSMDGNTAITTRAVRWAARLGMIVIVAAGNERQNNSWGGYIVAPADADSIISVGAIAADSSLALFSSHGPTYDGRIKPELVAQGMAVRCVLTRDSTEYTYSNGTSFSAPLITGSAALLLEAHPSWGPMDLRNALLATASRANNPDNDYGWGVPDILAAIHQDPATVNQDGGVTEEQPLRITDVYPNPLRTSGGSARLTIHWTQSISSPTSLSIYNLLGQHILDLYSLRDNGQEPGGMTVWNGTDATGRSLPSGVYIVRLTTGGHFYTRPITLIQ